ALLDVGAAVRTPRDREIVVKTVRLAGIDAETDAVDDTTPTAAEQLIFSRVLAIAERYARPVRLQVVPAHDVFDAIVTAVQRLQAAKMIGSHVHHHDVVRAALIQMTHQLSGPERDEALRAIRQVAKPADELAAAVRTRDFTHLRDIVRNRPPADLAELLAELSLEDQAVVFRLLPRRDAAGTFEYLDQDAREALLKTLSKEDVASLLNNMAPDDRTMFLEELPATVTREMLALLTPQERAIAVTLLGYPEKSVGRLMTPDYVAVREDWSVQQVLDYVRAHGQDSETLNVIYVVDGQGILIDDVRIREFLLRDPAHRVSDLMDRRFVALKATDDQQTAVAVFRQHDRSALPVTD